MNTTATAIPAEDLAGQLLDAASGIPADTAATGLIIGHGHLLHRSAFRRVITAGPSITILRIAASIGDPAIPVHLRAVLGNLDSRNITLVTDAITSANG